MTNENMFEDSIVYGIDGIGLSLDVALDRDVDEHGTTMYLSLGYDNPTMMLPGFTDDEGRFIGEVGITLSRPDVVTLARALMQFVESTEAS